MCTSDVILRVAKVSRVALYCHYTEARTGFVPASAPRSTVNLHVWPPGGAAIRYRHFSAPCEQLRSEAVLYRTDKSAVDFLTIAVDIHFVEAPSVEIRQQGESFYRSAL